MKIYKIINTCNLSDQEIENKLNMLSVRIDSSHGSITNLFEFKEKFVVEYELKEEHK